MCRVPKSPNVSFTPIPFGPCWDHSFICALLVPFLCLGPDRPSQMFGPCWAHSFVWAMLGPFIYLCPLGPIHSRKFEFTVRASMPSILHEEAQCTVILPFVYV